MNWEFLEVVNLIRLFHFYHIKWNFNVKFSKQILLFNKQKNVTTDFLSNQYPLKIVQISFYVLNSIIDSFMSLLPSTELVDRLSSVYTTHRLVANLPVLREPFVKYDRLNIQPLIFHLLKTREGVARVEYIF